MQSEHDLKSSPSKRLGLNITVVRTASCGSLACKGGKETYDFAAISDVSTLFLAVFRRLFAPLRINKSSPAMSCRVWRSCELLRTCARNSLKKRLKDSIASLSSKCRRIGEYIQAGADRIQAGILRGQPKESMAGLIKRLSRQIADYFRIDLRSDPVLVLSRARPSRSELWKSCCKQSERIPR
ncbi:hypothetical protein AAMO2058_001240000 [Amorphochlora amoebiformis]